MKSLFSAFVLAGVLLTGGAAQAQSSGECPGVLALRAKDIVLQPGVSQRIVLDFSAPECANVQVFGLWAYLADPLYSSVRGCSNQANQNMKIEMRLVNQSTGLVGIKYTNLSTILQDPNQIQHGATPVGGNLVTLDIQLDASVRKCANLNLRYAFGMTSR